MENEEILHAIQSIVTCSSLPQEKRINLEEQIRRINTRINDDNVYIGIVGEFSSGKSTLINSLIGADFFITNSIQGTTTVVTKLYYGEKINLSLKYKDGTNLSYCKNKRKLLKRYLQDEYHELSLWRKMFVIVKDIFHLNGDDAFFMKLFEDVTTSDEISQELDSVSVFYPSEILRNGIVVVDTPGTDSLNPIHAEITQRAIRDICDTSIVVVPATKPLSKTLVDFLDENVEDNIDKCVFFITKIETLRKDVERRQLRKVIEQRIKAYLKVESPYIIVAPTLLSLEERAIIEETGILYLQKEERISLTNAFDADLKNLVNNIISNKDTTINNSIIKFTKELTGELREELTSKENSLQAELYTLHQLQTIPLSDFIVDYFKVTDYEANYDYVKAKVQNKCDHECSNFKKYVKGKVQNADTKDETQGVMALPQTSDYGQACFTECYENFILELKGLREYYESDFENFKRAFTERFSIESLDFSYELEIRDSWQKEYDINFKKSGLTTFPLFRYFKSLESVKEQVITVVMPKIDNIFEKMYTYYANKLQISHDNLDKQMQKVRNLFFSKYEKIINQRIKEEKLKEEELKGLINHLKTSIQETDKIINILK